MIERHLIIIGAMKSATTSLYSMLARHPRICPNATAKEPAFFCDDAEFARGLEFYDAQWQFDPQRHRYALEASTRYTKSPFVATDTAAARMRATGRAFRFVYVVRDPVERMASHIRHQIAHGIVGYDDRFRYLAHAVQISSYGAQLRRFFAGYPDADVRLVDYDAFVTDPWTTVSGIQAALGLDVWRDVTLPVHLNATPAAVPPGAAVFSPDQVRQLRDALKPDMEIAAREFGLDVARWGF